MEAMNEARVTGLLLDIASFRLGSAYGYTPNRDTDNALRGTIVHPIAPNVAVPSNFFRTEGPDGGIIINLSCILPASVGDFNYGELGLYLPNGTLFGLCAFDSPISKLANTGGSEGNSLEMKVKIITNIAVPTINVSSLVVNAATLVGFSSANILTPPSVAEANILRTQSLDEFGRAGLYHEATSDRWHPMMHDNVVYNGTVTWASPFSIGDANLPNRLGVTFPPPIPGRYVLQFMSGTLAGRVREVTPIPAFQASVMYPLNFIVQPATPNGYSYVVSQAGTTGSSAVTWPTNPGGTVQSGTAIFTVLGPVHSYGLTWAGSTATAATPGTQYRLLRASSFTGLERFMMEYLLKTRAIRHFSHHH